MHRVSTQPDPIWPPISPALFEEIVVYLKKNYIPVQLEKYLQEEISNNKEKKRFCALVFDDGYKDFVDYALPILIKHNFPSSMYVVVNCVENNLPPWTYLMNYIFINTTYKTLDVETDFLPLNYRRVKWTSDFDKFNYVKQISPILKSLPSIEAKKITDQFFSQLNDVELPQNLMMTWDDLKSVKSENCYIGSHSLSHPLLSKSIYTSEIEEELILSFNAIKNNLNHDPLTISYPFGASDYRVLKAAKKSGYKFGLNVNKIENIDEEFKLYNIPRIELFNESFLKSKLRINGYIEMIKNYSKLKANSNS